MSIRRIGIYGKGKVAISFGFLLSSLESEYNDYEIGYYGRTGSNNEYIEKFGGRIFQTAQELYEWCDCIGFIVTDGAIKDVARQFSSRHRKYAFHTSGVLSSEVLGDGWKGRFSLHPLRALAKVETKMDDTTFALELSQDSYGEIIEFVGSLGVKTIYIQPEQKALYHAAAVIASNLIVPVISNAYKQLRKIGISDPELLWPLIDSSIENMKKIGVDRALTGPSARGDLGTIQMHMEALSREDADLYKRLTLIAIDELSPAPAHNKLAIRRYLESLDLGDESNKNAEDTGG